MNDRTHSPRLWRIIDTTLREGEQFARASFKTDDKIEIARALDAFGVDYIEMTSPVASPQSQADVARVARLGLGAMVITHTRCVVDDVQMAVDAGVRGISLLFATSRILREASHGKGIQEIMDAMGPPIELALRAGLEVRFSAEDAFRSPEADVLAVHRVAEHLGVHRVGVADTVGIATPRQVFALFPRLAERQRQTAGTLSGGEQQMLAIGRCLMGEPRLILFDEPSLGLAPVVVEEMFRIIVSLNRDVGLTVVLVEQNVAQSLALAHRGYVLETGRIVLSGTGAELLSNDGVRQAYVGI